MLRFWQPIAGALVAVTMACSGSSAEAPKPPIDVQGHRGARGLLPENSLAGFQHAIELGVSTLELDLGVTRDRVVVVSHDPRIHPKVCRHADGAAVEEPGPRLKDLDLVEVQAFDCGSLNPDRERFPEPPRQNLPGTPIPTLAEVFELGAPHDSLRFNIEIKIVPGSDDTVPLDEFVELVLAEIQAHGLTDRVSVQCFDWRAFELVKRRDPQQQTVALLSPQTLDARWLAGLDPDAAGTALELLRAAPDVIDIFSPYWQQVVPASPNFAGSSVRELQEAGFPVVPWTVNERQQMSELLELGVDGLITDYPDVLIDLIGEQNWQIR